MSTTGPGGGSSGIRSNSVTAGGFWMTKIIGAGLARSLVQLPEWGGGKKNAASPDFIIVVVVVPDEYPQRCLPTL